MAVKQKTVTWNGVTFTIAPDKSRGGNHYIVILPGGKKLPAGTTLNPSKKTVDLPNGKHLSFKGGQVIQNTPVAQRDKLADRKYEQVDYNTGKPITAPPKPQPRSGDDRRQQVPVPTARPAARPAAPVATGSRGTSAPTPVAPAAAPRPTTAAPRPAAGGTTSGTAAAPPRPVAGAPAVAAPARPGAAPAAPGAVAGRPATKAKTDAEVRRMFGDVAAFLSDPELGPILRKAAAEGWDNSRLMGALTQTRFWKTKGDTERKWIILNRLDNATARRQVETQAASIWEMARSQGLNLSGLQVHDLSVNALKFGWSTAEMRTQMFAAATKQPGGLDTAVATQYGYLAAFLDNPEVGPLLQRAAREGWTEVRLEAELQKTNFWKTTTDSQRRFNAQLEQDPASAQQSINARASELLTTAQSLGVTIDPTKLKQIAEDSLRFGWNSSQTQKAITAEFDYQGGESGVAGSTARQVKNVASAYLVPMSDQAMEQWTEKIVRGEVDIEGFTAYAIEQAKSLFPGMAGALDRGITVEEYANPYKQTVARELEMNPEDIDFMDPKWRTLLDQKDAKGNRVAMTLSESAEYVRKLPEWQMTRGANEKAASLTESILKTFGAVA